MDDGPGTLISSRDLLHFVRRTMLPWTMWDMMADALTPHYRAAQVKHGLLPEAPGAPSTTATSLKNDAHASFGRLLEPGQCDDLVRYFKHARGFAGHHLTSSDGVERGYALVAAGGNRYFSYRPETVIAAPHLLALANRPEIVDTVSDAMGCLPTLYSVNAWWSFPIRGEPWPPHSQHFHRDNDDFRFFTLFVYLTDVDGEGDGPNQVIPGTQSEAGTRVLLDAQGVVDPHTREQLLKAFPEPPGLGEKHLGSAAHSTLGPRGTTFIADTRALHRGLAPRDRPRLIFWARYGMGGNSNSSDTDLLAGPVAAAGLEDTPRNRYVNRLLLRWD